MKKLKVMTVVGTRPEIIRLACVLKKLDASPAIDHVLVHTGQNYDYELNEVFFEDETIESGLRATDNDYYNTMSQAVNPYGDGLACERIINAL